MPTPFNNNREVLDLMVVPIDSLLHCPVVNFDDDTNLHIDALAESVKKYGIKQHLVVRAVGSKYEVVCGLRRWKAAAVAGLDHVPVDIRRLSDIEAIELAMSCEH